MKDGFEKRVDRWANNFEIMMRHRVTDIEALDKRISKLEGGIVASADGLADLEYRHRKRIETLDEIAHEHIGYSDPPVKPASCYREKHTCGECARAFRRDDSTRAICGSGYKWLDHSLDYECDTGDFEATP